MPFQIVLVEKIHDSRGKSETRLVGTLAEPELCRVVLDRLIIRRETELHRLKNLGKKKPL